MEGGNCFPDLFRNVELVCLNCNSVAKGTLMDQNWVVSRSNDMELISKLILIKAGEDHLMAFVIIAVLRIL